MKGAAPTILAAVLIVGCTPSDPIQQLVLRLSSEQVSGGMVFPSGPYHGIDLAPQAPVTELVAAAFKWSQRPSDQVVGTNFTLLTTRQVRISLHPESQRPQDLYTAVLVGTASGKRIVLLQFKRFPPEQHWWSHVYDIQ